MRVLVDPEKADDAASVKLARDIKERIEKEKHLCKLSAKSTEY